MDDFSKEVEELERALRGLKTYKRIPPTVSFYTATFTPSNLINPIVITYAAGGQPIIVDFYSAGLTLEPGEVVGNSQNLAISSQSMGTVTIKSTRPILSVTQAEAS